MSGKPDADPALVAELTALIDEGSTPEVDPIELAKRGESGWTLGQLTGALEALVVQGRLARTEKILCPVKDCSRPISAEDVAANHCPHCGTDLRTLDEAPIVRFVFRHSGPLSRDLQWAVVAHGMNTFGPWEEEFSWRLALKLRYSAPVLIYKYGMVRLGVLFRFRHRALVRTFGKRIRQSVVHATDSGRTRAPDVILHSFGTLLFAKLLDDPDFRDLRFGRVILAGSIVRPDHAWARFIRSGRVEAVLNHCGSKDHIVDLAAFAIPDTGPSGRVGFSDAAVLSVQADGFDHSTFFEAYGLDASLAPGNLWDAFLRAPPEALENLRMDRRPALTWRALPAPLRRIALPVVLLLGGLAVSIAGAALLWLILHIFTHIRR
jgi:hypothetical protein